MKKSLLILAFASSLFAGSCQYSVESSALQWMAFKTPAKVGVKGTFDNIDLNFKMSDSQESLLQSSKVSITTANVNSHNKGRDAKLVRSFFNVQGVSSIDAEVLKVAKDSADVEISMNGVKKVVTMKLLTDEDTIKLNGTIDLADFNMIPSLNSITKACYDLHQGKTWQDVVLDFTIKTSCK